MSKTDLDAATKDESWLTVWEVTLRDYRTAEGNMTAFTTERVTATTLELVDGALVFRGLDGEMVQAYGPSGWLEVSRA